MGIIFGCMVLLRHSEPPCWSLQRSDVANATGHHDRDHAPAIGISRPHPNESSSPLIEGISNIRRLLGVTMPSINPQETAFEDIYSRDSGQWAFHYTTDPLTRYLRDRRLKIALDLIERVGRISLATQSALVVCGGVGGEGTYLCNRGLLDVTISDFSAKSLSLCNELDPRLKTLQLNSESLDLPDNSYDLVLVQDGLHHLSRPVLGFTEMLRVARNAIVVIEPHFGLAGRLLGTTWEQQGDAINYVFRWNRAILEQSTRSYLLSDSTQIIAMRLWDHNLMVGKIVNHLPPRNRLFGAKSFYKTLEPFSSFGNMMVGVVLKT